MKIVIILFFIISSHHVFAQSLQWQNQQDSLLLKSKKQKTAGWIVMGTGIGLTVAGVIVNTKEAFGTLDGFSGEANYESATGKILLITGIAVIGTGTYLLITAHKTKKRAMSLSLNTDAVLLPAAGGWGYQFQPCIKLTIPLN